VPRHGVAHRADRGDDRAEVVGADGVGEVRHARLAADEPRS
jgi:hypothetical protein